jgi:F-type H+-transporting ATPase subunit alpha
MQFAGDLDQDTKARIESGRRYTELLKQDQHATLPFYKQVVSIFAANAGILDGAPITNVRNIESELFAMIERDKPEIFSNIENERAFSDETTETLTTLIETFKKTRTELYS